MRPNEIWEGKGWKTRLVKAALTPLGWLYACGWQSYLAIYALGIKKASEAHQPVICVGNLVTGGSGKSPLTLYLAKLLLEIGKPVVIGCSGYGAPHAEAATMAPNGALDAAEWGDEPAMFRWLFPEVPLVVGRRRVLAAELVHRTYPDSVLLMDDGFQHLPIKKHLTILLDDPDPVNTMCLPAGPYREPRKNRRRADAVLPGIFQVVADSMRLVTPSGSEDSPGDYSVLCALGQPARFLDALKRAFPNRQNSGSYLILPDHDPLTGGTLLASFRKDLPIVVTAKDWVKLRNRADIDNWKFLVATQRVRVEPEAEFREWLKERLDE